jgi:hypothetical protein
MGDPPGACPNPRDLGITPVNIEACEGTVQLAVEKADSRATPRAASWVIVGVLPEGAPYGSKASARAVSMTINMTFGGTVASLVRHRGRDLLCPDPPQCRQPPNGAGTMAS